MGILAVHITGDISAGSISIVVTLIGIAIGIGIKAGTIQQLIRGHSLTLQVHATRLDAYEKSLIEIGGNLQRMIGRIESTQDRLDRATGTRRGEGRLS